MTQEKKRILLVDDEPINLAILVNLLERSYLPVVAKNGPQALRLAQGETPPDLILLDVMMPLMDGYEVCRRLKENPATCAIPVLFVTALEEEDDRAEGMALGAVDCLNKPIDPEELLARVCTHLGRSDG